MSTALVVLACAGVLFAAGLRRVPEGQVYVVHRFGSYRRTLPAGVHWLLPLVERIARRISLRGRQTALDFDWRASGAATRRCEARLWYQVIDPTRAAAEVEDVESLVAGAARAAIRWLAERRALPPGPGLARTLKEEFNVRLRARGVTVTRVELSTPD